MYLKENPPKDKGIPGPGAYNFSPKLGTEASKYSIKGRTANPLLLTSTRHNPGPGAYAPKNEMNETGKYMIGNVHNSLAPSFSLPSLKRFQYVDNNKHFPGPGTYAPKIGISDNGS